MDSNLLGRCGIYCGACFVYRAFRDGGQFLDRIAEEMNMPKNMIRCSGCSGPQEELWQNCRKCEVAACLRNKGFDFCYECPSFEHGCDIFEMVRNLCSERGEDLKAALRRVKTGEADAWLKEQDEKWRCPSCRNSISWYEVTCHHCGNQCVSPETREKLEKALSRLKSLQPRE